MSALTDFLKAGFGALADLSGASDNLAAWNGQSLPAVYNDRAEEDDLMMGGIAPQGTTATLLIAAAAFASAERPRRGQSVQYRGKHYRVRSTRIGDAAVEIVVEDANRRAEG